MRRLAGAENTPPELFSQKAAASILAQSMGPSNQSGQSGQGQTGKSAGFPRRFGKYTLLSHLATGGMADVFLARHLGPAGFEKECVIKRILPHLAQDPNNQAFIDMFLDEARIAARLSHPNIVHIFDLGQVDGDYFLALEYVDGITIENMLERAAETGQAALPWPIAARIVSNVAEGLEHAHKATDSADNPLLLVHRDISPSNIMVSWDGVAKVLDFGIAKAMALGSAKVKTGVGIIKGKVPYMSPEQISGLDLDGRSDVFSLGVVLYEMTTGQRPFPGDTTGQLTVQITSRDPNPPELINPAFPRDLWPVLQRALAKDVDQRYQSARDFKMDLEQFLSDQLVTCTNYDVEAYLRELVPKRPRRELPSAEEIARVEAEVEEEAQNAGTVPMTPMGGAHQVTPPRSTNRKSGVDSLSGAPSSVSSPSRRTPPGDGGASGDPRAEQAGDSSTDALEADHDAEQRRHRRQSGGSGLIMGAIAVLIVATGVIFYVLHERAVNQTQVATPQADNPTAPTPPVTQPATQPPTPATNPAANPAATAAKPAGETPTPAAEKKPADKVEKAEKPEKTDKPEKAEAKSEPEKQNKPETAEKSADSGEEKPKPKPRRKKHDDDAAPAGDTSHLPLPPPPPPDPS